MGTSQGREWDAGGKKREGAIKHQSYSSCKMDDLQMKISWVGPLGWIKALSLPEVMKSGCHVNR